MQRVRLNTELTRERWAEVRHELPADTTWEEAVAQTERELEEVREAFRRGAMNTVTCGELLDENGAVVYRDATFSVAGHGLTAQGDFVVFTTAGLEVIL